jgi:excinuclease ABC subunit B
MSNAAKDDLRAAEQLAASVADAGLLSEKDLGKRMKALEKEMLESAKNLEFEKAARLRDQLALLKEQAFGAVVHDHVVVSGVAPRA